MENNQETWFVQISAGRGPAECCWVVAQALRRLLKDCEALGFCGSVTDRQEGTENGTLTSALVMVSGKEVEQRLGFWRGTVQWIGQSPYRKFHKRKNWFIGVAFFSPGKASEWKSSDVVFKAFRGSGPGGQHRNKVETAVRATHIPSGISVYASEERSQYQNKQLALKKLEAQVKMETLNQQQRQLNDQWMEHLHLERGGAVLVFEGRNFQQK